MTLTKEAAALTLTGPASLVANIPTLIGFTPDQSIIAIWLKGGSLLVTQRADLDLALADPGDFFGPMRKHQPDEVILVVWSDRSPDEDPEHFDDKVEAFIEYAKADVEVRDALWVHRGAWGSLICDNASCCPPGGREIDSSLVLDLGKGEPASHRETLLAECLPAGAEHMKPLTDRAGNIEVWRDKMIDLAIDTYLDFDAETDMKVAHKIGRALHDVRVRDTLLWEIARMEPEGVNRAYVMASAVCRSMHPDDAAPAAAVACLTAWLTGDGARANIAVDYAKKADAYYSLTLLLDTAISAGLPPNTWREATAALTRDDCRHGKK